MPLLLPDNLPDPLTWGFLASTGSREGTGYGHRESGCSQLFVSFMHRPAKQDMTVRYDLRLP